MNDKKRGEVDWEDVRIFLALARHGSLSAAARALSVNHATVARRIQSLEASMGERLAERRPEGYVLTAAGTRIMDVASNMETAAQSLGRGGASDTPTGLVRVNAPPGLAQGFLVRHLADIPARHPGLDLELATDLRSISLERHQADIAVRIGRPMDGDFIAKPLGHMAFGFYGTDEICSAVERGERKTVISFNEENADMPEALWMARHFPRARVSFRANNHVAQAVAATRGAGLALLPHYVGRLQPGLRRCELEPLPASREIWVLMRRQDRTDVPIRTIVEHLEKVFAEAQALFED
ncbi:LysR family transcriptional regulator [Luteibacter aegosomatissinici]|uniref:LysR family transcriptional regulator n=1 Tax=Luteibacter aegosomatissinici TaxID=2911539 RepID=UPI001FFC0D20|nr:LysR family transcriptional regulator [Luteibacter aegosomatissinici]UPG94544.1 LysR family transcriptional regulator [Luteibacter aegosomatissinici]